MVRYTQFCSVEVTAAAQEKIKLKSNPIKMALTKMSPKNFPSQADIRIFK